ncbi:MAG: FtsX-like permease family protein [Acidobacteriota bacterium]|nr:FtsX-like permease family protein [Acidobacteriota bacterium]
MSADAGRRRGSGLPLPLQVALRYLRSTRQDAFVSFLSTAAACCIALGVAALIVALAALSGFQGALRGEILGRTPEIEIELGPQADVDALVAGIEGLTVPGVAGPLSVQRLLIGRGWLMARGGARPVRLVAFDGELPALFPGVGSGVAGRAQGLYLGSALAGQWRLAAGDLVEVASARPTLTPLGPQPRVRRLPVAGIYESGRTETEDRVALPWAAGESLIGRGGLQLLVSSGELDRVDAVVAALDPLLPAGASVRTWRDLNRALLFALRLEKSLMFLGVFLIVVVAVLALVSGLMLILASKRREVGMLRAMGATPGAIRGVFLWLAALLAGAGSLAGLALGTGTAWALGRWKVLRLPDQVYFLDHVPFEIRPLDLAAVLGASLGLTLACAIWAAGRAARLRPVEALRR